jgi:hypothetical protein
MTESLASALAQVQTQLPKVGKSSTAKVGQYSYSYADLASIHNVVLPLLGQHGLAWMTMPTFNDDGMFVLRYELLHVSGECRVGHYPLPASTSKAQELGSAITYGRRYCLSSVIGIAPDDDDDGAAAQKAKPQRVPKAKPTLDVDSVRAALHAATSLDDLRELWPEAKAAGLQPLWKEMGNRFRTVEAVDSVDKLWATVMETVPEDWPTSKVEADFEEFTGVAVEKANAQHMQAYLAHLS